MKKLLIVVDYQNDFVNGALGNEAALALRASIREKIKSYQENGDDVIFTLDTHFQDYMETYEGQHLPVAHCIKGTKGHELDESIKDLAQDCLCFEKNTFPSLDLANYLKNTAYEDVTLIGVVSDICVLANAIMVKSALPNATIKVDRHNCASNDANNESHAYHVMSHSLQIEVI